MSVQDETSAEYALTLIVKVDKGIVFPDVLTDDIHPSVTQRPTDESLSDAYEMAILQTWLKRCLDSIDGVKFINSTGVSTAPWDDERVLDEPEVPDNVYSLHEYLGGNDESPKLG